MKSEQPKTWVGVVVCLLFAGFFLQRIWHESFVLSGVRYFNVLDDSLISMRYGWNLAHGRGAVWNPGEYVEGYTNPLMVLLTALFSAVSSKQGAVLLLQLSGLGWLIASGWLAAGLFRELFGAGSAPRRWGATCVMIATLAYYPLASLSIHGLETGLLTTLILLALRGVLCRNAASSPMGAALVSGVLALAYLARPDGALPGLLILLFLAHEIWHDASTRDSDRLGRLAGCFLPFVLVILLHLLWRWSYYGAWLPNTYYLKVGGIGTLERVADGFAYIRPFLRSMSGVVALALLGVALGRSRTHLLLAGLFAGLVGYHIYTGGDFLWVLYRFVVPGVPLLFILAMDGAFSGWEWVRSRGGKAVDAGWAGWVPIGALALALVFAARPYLDSWLHGDRVLQNQNRVAISRALTVESLTTPDAVVGVFGAGHLPYYSDRPMVDFLGKMDPEITRLPPHRGSPVARAHGGKIWPGHAKYDLEYSIKELQPDVCQGLRWLDQDLREWGREHYERLKLGPMVLYLKSASPRIHWSKLICEGGECRPGPGQL